TILTALIPRYRFMPIAAPTLPPILLAESDVNYALSLRRAFETVRISNPLMIVHDGQQAIDFLGRRGRYADPLIYPWHCLMLLSLKVPVKDGTEVLSWWQLHDQEDELPIIVLTAAASASKIEEIIELGAVDYRFQPRDLDGLIVLAHELRFGWVEQRTPDM